MITHRNILTSLALVFLIAGTLFVILFLAGCASGYRGLVPGKDMHLKNFKQEITTPWGHSLITADELDTIVKPDGTVQVAVPAEVTPKK
jgi:hypothetical protein